MRGGCAFPCRLRAVTDRAWPADRAVRLGNGNGFGLGMDIETDVTLVFGISDRLRRIVALALSARPIG